MQGGGKLKIMFIDKSHSQYLLKALSLLRQDEELCDIELRVGGTKVFAHKVVLAAVSDYFKAMFTGKMEESVLRTVHLHDIDDKSVALIVDFAYTGYISINQNNVESLLIASNMLGVSKIITACCNFLLKELHCTNCIGIFEFAERLSLKSLRETCLSFIEENFTDISHCDDFLTTDLHSLKQFLLSDNLRAQEKDIFYALERWTIHDKQNRMTYFPVLFNHIRLFHTSRRFLTKLVTNQLISHSSDSFLQLKVQSVLSSKKNPFRLLDEDFVNGCQYSRRKRNQIIVFGGKNSFTNPSLNSVHEYDINDDKWRSCKCSLEEKPFSSAAFLEGKFD